MAEATLADRAAVPAPLIKAKVGRDEWTMRAFMVLIGLYLVATLALPLWAMLSKSFQNGAGEFVGLANYLHYFGTPALSYSIHNSFFVSIVSTLITVPLAFVYAYALTRSCLPLKGLFKTIALVPILVPSMLPGIALVYLFGNQGMIKALIFGYPIYGPIGIVMAEVFFTFPHALLIVVTALALTDARLYEAAIALRASRRRIFFTVTLPGARYGLISAVFVVFTMVITDFGAPKIIGGKFSVMATEIYDQVVGQQNFTMGATVSVVLLIPALAAFVVDRLVQRRQYALISSSAKPLEPRKNPLAEWSLSVYCFLIAASIVGIYLVILVVSLVERWPYRLSPSLKHYSFDTVGVWTTLVDGVYVYTPLLNSIYVSALTAVVGTAIAFIGAYLVEKCRTRASVPLYMLSLLPVSIPGMVLGLAYIFTFNVSGSILNRLYGTLTILIISNLIHYFTVPFLTATTSLKQMDAEFENVGASMGVPFYKTFWRVTVPIALPSIIAISMYFFLNAMVTLSAVVFLVAPGTELAAVAVLLMDDAGDTAQAAALSVLIIAVGLLVRVVYWWLMRGTTRRTQAWTATAVTADQVAMMGTGSLK